ncbi:MAG: hypothetical protein P8008_04380 [Gammaproteobacteria bacterium]
MLKRLVLTTALALAATSAVAASDKAMIITQVTKPAECIASVHIRNIDGREKIVPAQGFELEPGRHTMTGTATLDLRGCPVARGNVHTQIPPLESDFEAGRKYWVGLDYSSPDRNEWALVIWKVE